MGRLVKVVGSEPDAQQGLRRAVVDHMKRKLVGNTEAGASGLDTIKADAFQTFVADNKAVLKASGMTDAEVSTFGDIAADIQRANRSLTAVKIPGQSNTAQDSGSVLERVMRAGGSGKGTIGFGAIGAIAGGIPGIVAGAAVSQVAKVVSAMKQAGLNTVDDIVEDALLHPERAKLLLQKLDPSASPMQWEKLAKAFANAATTTTNLESADAGAPFQSARRQ